MRLMTTLNKVFCRPPQRGRRRSMSSTAIVAVVHSLFLRTHRSPENTLPSAGLSIKFSLYFYGTGSDQNAGLM